VSDDLFTEFERLETCRRAEVTLENLHLLAQHFGGTAVYASDPDGDWIERKPHLLIPGLGSGRVEVGAWVDVRGSRWNPEPLSQGWSPAGTFAKEAE